MKAKVTPYFWKGKRVFLTGHTGFKGSWLSLWLTQMGAELKGFALAPPTTPAMFSVSNLNNYMNSHIGDIRDLETLTKSIMEFKPDIIIHMAAQSLVRLSYNEPVATYATNVMGTVNLLEAARRCSNLQVVVNITTDKCYENREWEWGYRENEPMGGHDPYSNSKGCAELVTSAYRKSFFYNDNAPAIASARAGNVIAGGDWATDRLIPDILRAFEKGQPAIVRNPQATRPWQHALEPLSGYLILAQNLWQGRKAFAEGWNFGPKDDDAKTVEWILDKMVAAWGPNANWQVDSKAHPHEAKYLKLDTSKAHARLNWSPTWSLEHTLEKIISWHRAWLTHEDMANYSLNEIENYMLSMKHS